MPKKNNVMNILYGIDEWSKDYSRYLWVSILSLLENNKGENIHIYILSKYIEESNKNELIRIVKSYWKEISFSEWDIVPDKYRKILYLWWWPLAAYYRRFFSNCFDIKDRVLYMDCDTIVMKNLSEFYNSDFEWNVFIWHLDFSVTEFAQRKKFWLKKYINSWVYLINIPLFEKVDLYEEVIKVNNKFNWVDFPDQDYVNIIFQDRIKIDENLQCIVNYKRTPDFDKYLILHTTVKPNVWWYWWCSQKIEKIFNDYLIKTKRKTYIWFKRKITWKQFLSYIYDSIRFFMINVSLKFFWVRCACHVRSFFNKLTNIIGTSCRKLWLIK